MAPPWLTLLLATFIAQATIGAFRRAKREPVTACNSKSEVVFLVDSSDVVGRANLDKEIHFIQETIQHWDISPNGTQVGLVSFGSSAKQVFNLNTFITPQDVISALSTTPLIGGQPNMQEGLRYVTDYMFTPQSGIRDKTSRIVILITNGHSSNRNLAILQGKTTQSNDIQVYTVGIGDGIDSEELKGVASDPDGRYAYTADTFESASALTNIIGPKICNDVPNDPNFLPKSLDCLQKADIVFMLDSSSSIGKDNFHKLQDFLKDVAQNINISADGVHVGLMQFSSHPSVEFPLSKYSSRYDVLKAIDQVSFMGGGANTGDALQYLRQQMFSQSFGARPGVPHIAIVITDGASSSSGNVVIQANNARLEHIVLLAVGVGPSISTPDLQAIADDPDYENMFTETDYEQLRGISKNLVRAACKVQGTAPPSAVPGASLPPDPCQDTAINCVSYGKTVCTNYTSWAETNCQRFCGFCQPLYTPAPPTCDNVLNNCASYGVGACQGHYKGWAVANCKRYCGYCELNAQTLGYYGSCYYKGKTYITGEQWIDGCDYSCVCEDGSSGRYRCYNRCPIYHNLPPECTLVRNPNECCLQPQCYFNQRINTISASTIGNIHGINTCEYKGMNYYQGQTWQDGCDYQCVCKDSSKGYYECQDFCPKYHNIPSYCRLEQDAGSCCSKPVCEFDMQQGSFTGLGSTSGYGIENLPPTLPPCIDSIDNCPIYGKGMCLQYRSWALSNCRSFCELCGVDRYPGEEDVCMHDGLSYHQDETWHVGNTFVCSCEKATQGYYRCVDLCPQYTNIPAGCQMIDLPASPCPSLHCGSGTFISSSTNLYTLGNGGNIYTGASYIAPSVKPGLLAPLGSGGSADQATAINGCLYKGQIYVLGQQWNDGCEFSCNCLDATTGRYQCRTRCPRYLSMPTDCQLVVDTADTCCTKPFCTGTSASNYIPVPVYGVYQSMFGIVKPPAISDRYTDVTGTFGPTSGYVHMIQTGTSVPPPTVGNFATGGIGYCIYKGKQYLQSDTWEDGCLYNCVCDDASFGHYKCVDKCVNFTNIPEPWCHLVQDPANACCKIPECSFTAPPHSFTGWNQEKPSSLVTHFTTTPVAPVLKFCVYNGSYYDQNQIWYVGCKYRCTCEDPATNNYRCLSRCPMYENIDQSQCKFVPDPDDPGCCSVPICAPPTLPPGQTPNPTAAVTFAPGFVTNSIGGTIGTNPGYCTFDGERYQKGDTWEDGCDYHCVCEDPATGEYRCTQKCSRYSSVPDGCRLVSDFTNPCCEVLRCTPTFILQTPSPMESTLAPNPNLPSTPVPIGFCSYKGVQYKQSESWMDGCDKKCRCDNANTGIYTCSQRCLSYDRLPPECKMVTDPKDRCCLIASCEISTATPVPLGPTLVLTPSVGSTLSPPTGSTLSPPTGSTLSPPTGSTLSPPTGSASPLQTPGILRFATPTAIPGIVTGYIETQVPTIGPDGKTQTPGIFTYCEYKGIRYEQGQTWVDGCSFNCECVNALQGKYLCRERCPRFINLPPQCRLVKNAADPCCEVAECGPAAPTSVPTPPTFLPGSTLSPPLGGSTVSPGFNLPSTPQPTATDVCVYKNKAYSQGQRWFDGCDYQCVCENGAQGLYTCGDRCNFYPGALPTGCTMEADPADPFCCKKPVCPIPHLLSNQTGFITFPTPPQPIVTGGRASPFPTPRGPTPSYAPTLSPPTGQTTSTAAPTIPNNVCVYKGRTYKQGQSWRDGCDYDCKCEDALTGHYTCRAICSPLPELPPQCSLVLDVNKPCCKAVYCEATTKAPQPISTVAPPSGSPTLTPPSGGSTITPPLGGSTQTPPMGSTLTPIPNGEQSTVTPTPGGKCLYNGASFRQGQTWDDACDLKCFCEDASTGYYRCNSRCPRFDNIPPTCTFVTDPQDSCCRVPLCSVITPATNVPQPDNSSSQVPLPDHRTPIPTGPIPTPPLGIVDGYGIPSPTSTLKSDPNDYNATQAPPQAPGCLYKGIVYQQGHSWEDGCLYNCVCTDGKTSHYSCQQKCQVYTSIPPNCHLVNDPNNPCCKIQQCLPPTNLIPSTPTPNPLESTLTPLPHGASTPLPGTFTTLTPQLPEVCRYNGKSYTSGQQWYDGCAKVCVCENGQTGFYRCSDRCSVFDNVPNTCIMVPDPNDAECCEIPQCSPTPNPNFPNPTPGPTSIVSPPIGYQTGRAPVPTKHSGGSIPSPQAGCLYNNIVYRQHQRWQEGCDFNCECSDETTGAFRCTQRCPVLGLPPPRCSHLPDPKDFCCMIEVCDFSHVPTTHAPAIIATPTLPAGQTPPIGQTTPSAVPVAAICVTNRGLTYGQGATWKDGCSRICRCDDAVNNIYSCFDRCPTFNLQPGCQLVTDPNDACCQVSQCTALVTPSPTPYPNGSLPNKLTELVPIPIPGFPGVIIGTPATPTGSCEYKGGHYKTGATWNDGCDYKCSCVDDTTGTFRCVQRCQPYPNIPAYCVMVQDPQDQCCRAPLCPGLLTPPTATTPKILEPTQPTSPDYSASSGTVPGVNGTLPNGGTPARHTTQPPPTTPAPVTLWPPIFSIPPTPTGSANPVPKEVCIYMGKAYTKGQQWFDGCTKSCVCDDATTGFYSCTDRCATYENVGPDCIMAADPKDPLCCKAPMCESVNTNQPPTVIGVFTGRPVTPTPGPSPKPGVSLPPVPTLPSNVCIYKGSTYSQGQRWQDGCDFDCECVDSVSRLYKCTDKCPRYPNLPTTCVMVYDPTNPCCKKALCGSNVPSTQALSLGPSGEVPTPGILLTPNPNGFCLYQAAPYHEGVSWNVGCDKICRCEDASVRLITCRDRCASYPVITSGCQMITDPADSCCQILACDDKTILASLKSIFGGVREPLPNIGIGSSQTINGYRNVCVYNGQIHKQGETWEDGCSYSCYCMDGSTGKYICQEKCARIPEVPSSCALVMDPQNPCCKALYCPKVPATPTPVLGATTISPSAGSEHTATPLPIPQGGCLYNNQVYKNGQMWYDGCDKTCHCEDASRNFYRCEDRCSKFDIIPSECTLMPDPADPTCCKVPQCPLIPTGGAIPTPGYVIPIVTPPTGVITGHGKIPTLTPHPGQSTLVAPTPAVGCYYQNVIHQQGETWDDSCQYACECTNGLTGAYRCRDKCGAFPNTLPDPYHCRFVQDPNNTCCPVPYCDYGSKPVFPTPGIAPSNIPKSNLFYNTQPMLTGTVPPGYCVYKGVYYTQGQEWTVGCSQHCRCEDVSLGYYTCFDRCKTYEGLSSSCVLKADPTDSCCLIPDCNLYPNTAQPPTKGPHGETEAPVFVKPVAIIGGTIIGIGGTNPGGLNSNQRGNYGGRLVCVYKGVPYTQGQVWDDGCQYQCECIDGGRGQYACSEKCSKYPFLPPECTLVNDTKNACCKLVSCNNIPPPTATTTTLKPTSQSTVCIYTDGNQFKKGDSWNVGCSLSCQCIDPAHNGYICTERCPMYSFIPPYCHLAPDVRDSCCKTIECNGSLIAIIGVSGPTLSPTLSPNELNVVPVGSHTSFVGSNPMSSDYIGSQFSGVRAACVYKNQPYRQGVSWEDGCSYVCICDDENTGVYKCTSKCPFVPPLPSYCSKVTLPGQCCPVVSCTIPQQGAYNPISELNANMLPTPGPTPQGGHRSTPDPQQIILVLPPNIISSLSGGGAVLPQNTNIGGLSGKCVIKDSQDVYHVYNPGEKWSEECKYDCECVDGISGFFNCTPKCVSYQSIPSQCSLEQHGCCKNPVCSNPDGTTVDVSQHPEALLIFPIISSLSGGYSGYREGYIAAQTRGSFGGTGNGCIYKGKLFQEFQEWDDGCDFHCKCENGTIRQFMCEPSCPRYTYVPPNCKLPKDPNGCCDLLDCTPVVTTTPSNGCMDKLLDCSSYDRETACVGQFSAWAHENCPLYCGYCNTENPISRVCKDNLPNCADYGVGACAPDFEAWARDNCAKFCNMCPTVPTATITTTAKPRCIDLLPNCASLGDYVCVNPYTAWAIKNCNATCNKYLNICNCDDKQFKCSDGHCINGSLHCNRHEDCPDGSDEHFCKYTAGGSSIGGVSGNGAGIAKGKGGTIGGTGRPDWLILLKGVSNVSEDLVHLWTSSETRNENNPMANNVWANFKGDYKPAVANYWDQCNFSQIRVSVFKEGEEMAAIAFNATGANKLNWFDPKRVIYTTYDDLTSSNFDFFNIQGDSSMGRQFYINQQSNYCSSKGWIMVSTQTNCFYERGSGSKPSFFYAPGKTVTDWRTRAEGDVFVLSALGGNCVPKNATQKAVCKTTYSNKEYNTGEVWQEGCLRNCTCVDQFMGSYVCHDLCPAFSSVPPDCQLVTPLGRCCAELSCPSHTETYGCYYKGIFYRQGATWEDGCSYRCRCEDESKGFYTCRTRCADWELPSSCFLEPLVSGRCCRTPRCPAGISIVVPPGYESEYPDLTSTG